MKDAVNEYPYLYETHFHTKVASACAKDTPEDMIQACKEYGYTGVIVTDHNWGGNTCIDKSLPWDEFVDQYCLSYERAKEEGLDLVKIAPQAKPPVCKIIDYGKFKYEQARKEKEARKKQKTLETKEIRITPNIEQHDFEFKCKNAKKFLEEGNKVKITVKFRGRELNYVKLGEEALNQFIEELSDVATPEKKPLLEGKNMFVILAKKTDK